LTKNSLHITKDITYFYFGRKIKKQQVCILPQKGANKNRVNAPGQQKHNVKYNHIEAKTIAKSKNIVGMLQILLIGLSILYYFAFLSRSFGVDF